jgi:hypothetical protein
VHSLAETLLRSESIASSRIEGLHRPRAAVYSILRRRDELGEYVPPISLVLSGVPRNYIAALTAYRQSNDNAIVELYAIGTAKACTEAKHLGAQVDMLREQWEARLPRLCSHATARTLVDVLPAAPVLDANEAAARTGARPSGVQRVSFPTSFHDVEAQCLRLFWLSRLRS